MESVTIFAANWRSFLGAFQSFLSQLENTREYPSADFCEYAVDRLELWMSTISHLIEHLSSEVEDGTFVAECIAHFTDLLRHLRIIRREWEQFFTGDTFKRNRLGYAVGTIQGEPGRPKYSITKEQLQYLRSMCFSWIQIAALLGVSCSTVYRRRVEFELLQDSVGHLVEDATLIELVTEMKRQQPALGQTMVWGQLRSQGYQVTRARVRNAIRSADPINTALHWHDMTPRRPYSVPGPNSLWHLGR